MVYLLLNSISVIFLEKLNYVHILKGHHKIAYPRHPHTPLSVLSQGVLNLQPFPLTEMTFCFVLYGKVFGTWI
jgi:hypothetical protein